MWIKVDDEGLCSARFMCGNVNKPYCCPEQDGESFYCYHYESKNKIVEAKHLSPTEISMICLSTKRYSNHDDKIEDIGYELYRILYGKEWLKKNDK